jgi:WD40 repeat protein
MSEDGSKIVYAQGTDGLFSLDTFSLPLGFGGGPKQITDGDMTGASYIFSPDGREILVTLSNSVFLLDTGSFTPQNQRVNIASTKDKTLAAWKLQEDTKNQSLIKNLPPDLNDILSRKVSDFTFSPDNNMILYTASSSATLPDGLIAPLPGSSTQRQERNLQPGHTYVYDIKEDRNFLATDQPVTINNIDSPASNTGAVRWMSTSRELLLAQLGQVIIMDYDGTNRQTVYSGSYFAPSAFPFTNATKLLILTNLGAPTGNANLYTLTVK